ncbi:MAG TPA: type II secretion system protein GspF, partial [bacterium]|nr:type II secretion system protein GspF [bacterium]
FPYVGKLYKKLYLSRVTDNLETLLSSGVSVVRALEITADVVGNRIYEKILKDSLEAVKGGVPISEVFSRYKEIPPLVSQMIRVGEESGKLGFILKTLAGFYKREVDNSVENLVSLIEPVMIIALGLAVGILLVSILGPIYNITSAI